MNKYQKAFNQIKVETKEFLNKEYRMILEIWLFVQAMLGITLSNDNNKYIWIILILVSFVVLIVLVKFIKTIKEVQKPMKRFTKKFKNGDIFVEENRLHQALIYLSILEDQLED